MRIPILQKTDHFLVVNKPAGLLSVPDRHDHNLPNLLSLLRRQTSAGILPVHRLDRLTSGAMLVARTPEAQRSLSSQFEQRTVQKSYLALVEGRPANPAASIDQPLAPHPAKAGKMMVSAKGKPAQSAYVVKDFFGNYSLLEVEITTGRTHQIRVHLAYIGHPLLVDADYGNRDQLLLSSLKGRKRYNLKRGETERPLLSRTPLHSWRLAFHDPVTNAPLSFEVEPPKDIRATINQLKKLT